MKLLREKCRTCAQPEKLDELALDMKTLVSQGYDGVACMSNEVVAVAAEVQRSHLLPCTSIAQCTYKICVPLKLDAFPCMDTKFLTCEMTSFFSPTQIIELVNK